MPNSTHHQTNHLKQKLHRPALYHLTSKNYRYMDEMGERLDEYQAYIQRRLWEIGGEKSRIESLITSLDQQWHKLDRDCSELQEVYSQIQIVFNTQEY